MFPKLFANMFSWIPYIGIWISYLPEMIEFTKMIMKLISQGVTEIQIKRDMKRIAKAFSNPDRQQASKDLNDIFKGK